jgi:crotonobetainyl-CoA:carnitine CoA-transferase CaiB-like acyl-CoA transferase
MSYAAPYAGLKVIDVSQGVAGPYCAMMLAQYGANVIKVEPTDTGD